jgi:4-hydroxybenzoate polyprenyltransferase
MAGSVDFELHPSVPGAEPAPDLLLEELVAASPAADEVLARPPAAAPIAPHHWLIRRLLDFAQLMRLDRPIGIWLLLWPALWALWIASGGHPQPRLLLIFAAGTVLMRSAGCVINDFLDRDIDPHVHRTRHRPLAARRIAPIEALVLCAALLAAAFGLVLQLNAATVRLSFIGAALTLSYPLFKRFFPIPQLYLGLSFGWAVPMVFSAELGAVPRVGWMLMLAAVVWAGVYDTFYAMADRPDDLRVGVKSSAITFGDLDLLLIGAMQVMVLLSLLFVGRLLQLGAPYFASLGVAAGFFAWQLWLARRRDAAGCMRAFHNNNYFGIVILAGVILEYAARH